MNCQILFYQESKKKKKKKKKKNCHLLIHRYKRFKGLSYQKKKKKKTQKNKKKQKQQQYITNAVSKKGIHGISCFNWVT